MSNNTAGVGALSQSYNLVNFAAGLYTGDGSGSIGVAVGFTPRYVKVVDVTDATVWEWMEGFPATNSLKTVTAGTTTITTASEIVTNASIITVTEEAVGVPGAQAPGEGTQGTVSVTIDAPVKTTPQLTLSTLLNVNAKVYAWMAQG